MINLYDGVDDENRFVSRNGKILNNFNIFDDEIHAFRYALDLIGVNPSYPLDGEVTSIDKKFQKVMTQIHRLKDIDSNIFRYNIFDIIIPNMILRDRLEILSRAFKKIKTYRIKLLEHYPVKFKNYEELYDLAYNYCQKGEEGIVVKNINSLYEGKRSPNWLKIKKKHSIDLSVIGFDYGTGKYENILGCLICDHNGKKVRIGSGFTDKERMDFINNQPSVIEIEYQEITKDGSLRFPIFCRIRDDM